MIKLGFWSAIVVLLASACTSTPAVAPPRPSGGYGDEVVAVRELAARHGLTESYEARQNRLLLTGPGQRVLLFPGTTVAVVNGTRIERMGKIRTTKGGWTILAVDVARIEAAMANQSIAVHSGGSALRPVPEPVVETSPAVLPVADSGWRVPLRRSWRYIILHHSGTASGNATTFGRVHRDERGWDGLGYDFVIGNGHGSPDGRVEVGYRWRDQVTGAHAGRAPDGSNVMNEEGIGICLVGSFDRNGPTAAQRRSLARLIAFLRDYCRIPAENVLLHGDVRDTECPGRMFPKAEFVKPGRIASLPGNLR